ncbi:hypothetical protein ACLOJK_016830, partial [Asimina triloba]
MVISLKEVVVDTLGSCTCATHIGTRCNPMRESKENPAASQATSSTFRIDGCIAAAAYARVKAKLWPVGTYGHVQILLCRILISCQPTTSHTSFVNPCCSLIFTDVKRRKKRKRYP